MNCTYVLQLSITAQKQQTGYTINQIFQNKNLIEMMSPIDAYMCGVILSLEKNMLSYANINTLLCYLSKYNKGRIISTYIRLINIDLFNKIITVNIGDSTKQIQLKDFIQKPYLLNCFRSCDAAQIGILSMDDSIGIACQS